MRFVVGVAFVIAVCAWAWPPATNAPPRAHAGWALYDRLCVSCHGADGDGRGPASPYSTGRPRSFAAGPYKWTHVAIGAAPFDEDLAETIRHGAPGTSMPAFALSDAQVAELVDVVKSFSPATFAAGPGARIRVVESAAANGLLSGEKIWNDAGCVTCHGAARPFDLSTQVLHRPRATDDLPSRIAASAQSIATGIAGTPMPGYSGTLTDDQILAVARYVVQLNANAKPPADRSQLDVAAIALDRTTKQLAGTWPGTGPEAIVFGTAVPPQGVPPATLAPAQASLGAQQCGRCHAKQVREWTGSIHAGAASRGLVAQIDYALPATEAASCRRCHTPLAEQTSDLALRSEGIQCAGCHVRQWTRHGPPTINASLLPLPGYPLQTLELYERADFCMTCHQLPARTAVNGKPLLNTYKEWLEGPYAAKGVQCQHCHMPNREHTFLGVHDPVTFRQGIKLTASARIKDHLTTVTASIANIGAGHSLPTTATPAVYLTIELLDASGALLPNATATQIIGRSLTFANGWTEQSDTRIPPGQHITLTRGWLAGGRADRARITVTVHPDALYERIYAERLAGKLAPAQVTLYREALAIAIKRRYVAETQILPLVADSWSGE